MAGPAGSDKKPGLDPRLQAKFLEQLEAESVRLTRLRRIRNFVVSPLCVAVIAYYGYDAVISDGMARMGSALIATVGVLALAWTQREWIRDLLGFG